MDNLGEIPRSETAAERAQRSIEKTFHEIGLVNFLPKNPTEKTIAIVGAGSAVEVGAITNYFVENGIGKPKIICFDVSTLHKRFTEEFYASQNVNLEYREKDITDPSSFESEQYDMVVVRKPDVHSSKTDWERIFENSFNHLKSEGVFLATTDIYADFVLGQLRKGGEVINKYEIPDQDMVSPYFNEPDLFIARKRK